MEADSIEELKWKFKAKDRLISIFPKLMLHAASVDGLKWISFMGDLIALITIRGTFKIIAVDYEQKEEFLVLIEHDIIEGEGICNAQIFPC